VDRGVTHELVRHRLAAYSQESTRYCDYSGGVTFIVPPWVNIAEGEYDYVNLEINQNDQLWMFSMLDAEASYKSFLKSGWSPQQARSVLPNSLKTEIVMTADLREWRHVLRLRTAKAAHPQMQEIMRPLLNDFKKMLPSIFSDIEYEP
jgi:thymidylate synthase (FAD)